MYSTPVPVQNKQTNLYLVVMTAMAPFTKNSNIHSYPTLTSNLSKQGPSTIKTSKHSSNGECSPINVRKDSTKWQLESQIMHRMISLRK